MSGPPEMERGRPAAASMSPAKKNKPIVPVNAHCCGVLTLTELQQCARFELTCGPRTCARLRLAELRAETALHCAQLRHEADGYEGVAALEPHAAWLRIQLLDFADLIEAAQRQGWFA